MNKTLFLLSIVALLAFTSTTAAQSAEGVKCVVKTYVFHKQEGRQIVAFVFSPKLGEEELTNKTLRLAGTKLFLTASVFPTDESMYSAKGADSLRLALAISSRRLPQAFDAANNAVAEVTFAALDTVRVEKNIDAGRKSMRARLECWDPQLEKQK